MKNNILYLIIGFLLASVLFMAVGFTSNIYDQNPDAKKIKLLFPDKLTIELVGGYKKVGNETKEIPIKVQCEHSKGFFTF